MRSVAGPATSALRAITRASGPGSPAAIAARDAAAQIAWGFRALFNLPEAMALIRGGQSDTESVPYWQQVVAYCAAGNLQAVLDEYVHVLRDLEGLFAADQEVAWDRLASTIVAALTLRTGAPRVQELRSEDERVRLENHRMRNLFRDAVRHPGTRRRFRRGSRGAGTPGFQFAFSGRLRWLPLPSVKRDWIFTLTATPSCTGICRRIRSTSSNAKAACTDSRGLPCVRTWRPNTDPKSLPKGLVMLGKFSSNLLASNPWRTRPRTLLDIPVKGRCANRTPRAALPLSRDASQFDALKRSLAVYRMVFGQPRQDDLLAVLQERLTPDELSVIAPELRIDLSPPSSCRM